MNNKELIALLSSDNDLSNKESQDLANALISLLTTELQNGNSLSIQGFGNFEVKKKMERIVVNPLSRKRMLVPPKLVVNFKPSNVLKDKMND